jgi:hypothetical protein
MNDATDTRSLGDLIGNLASDTTSLFRKEVQLARTEISEKVGQIQAGLVSLIIGGVFALAGFIVLLQGIVAWLAAAGLGVVWASLLVGLVVAIIGAVLLKAGQSKMKINNLAPDRAAHQLRKDAELARETVR